MKAIKDPAAYVCADRRQAGDSNARKLWQLSLRYSVLGLSRAASMPSRIRHCRRTVAGAWAARSASDRCSLAFGMIAASLILVLHSMLRAMRRLL